MKRPRGVALTIFATLFGLLAISNFLKPVLASPGTGFVFFGTRTTGVENAILGPLFGLILAAYVVGIWRMKKYAMPMAYAYFLYVLLNTILFTVKNRDAQDSGGPALRLLFLAVGLGIPLASALILTRRRDELT
jgi:predicted PurR-regulated permease PerM